MIPLSGLGTQMSLKLVDATRDRQIQSIERSPVHARAITSFRERIADVQTVDQLIEDQELYAFVMRTYDLEDQIFGKAMMKKVLESDIDDRTALVNRLTDPRIRDLYKGMGFETVDGKTTSSNTLDPAWQEAMIDRYLDRQFINAQAEQSETVGIALEVRQKAGKIGSWLDVLKDRDVSSFFRTALGLPDSMVQLDVDRQAALFARKFDIEKLQDPKELEKLTRKYAAIADAKGGTAVAGNAAVQLMQGAVSAGNGGAFVPITLDITAITALPRRTY